MKMMIVVAAFLVAIGILVAVHEFGHYWVAKKLGFKVLRFSIGFGKPLWTRVGAAPDHTEYCIAAIPLGGYVKLLDEREGDVSAAELPRSFTRRPIAHRVAVLFAGPAMNFLFAALLYALLAMGGTEIAKPVVGDVRPGSPAALAGLARGDTIVQVGDRRIDDLEALQIALIERFTEDGTIPLRVTHDGSERTMTLTVSGDHRTLTEPGKLLPGLGFDLASWRAPITVQSVPADSAGAKAGLRAGDRLLAVDGHDVGNSPEFISAVSASPGRDVAIDLQRGDERLHVIAAVPAVVDQGRTIGRLGITLQEGVRTWPPGVIQMRRSGPIDAVVGGLVKTWDMSALTVQMLARGGRPGVGEEHQRADQHRRICGRQRVFGHRRLHGLPRHHQRQSRRPQLGAGPTVGRWPDRLPAGRGHQGQSLVGACPVVRPAGRYRLVDGADESCVL
jgi:regulator of sigma E protease